MAIDPEVQEAMEQAEASLTQAERDELTNIIFEVAQKRPLFTVDRVWEQTDIPEHRGIGAIMQMPARAGVCMNVGYVPKPSAQGGRWQVTLWKSLIYKGPSDAAVPSGFIEIDGEHFAAHPRVVAYVRKLER